MKKRFVSLSIGSVMGFLTGATGAGGAVLANPMLNQWLGLTQHQVAGTGLVSVLGSSVMGGGYYFYKLGQQNNNDEQNETKSEGLVSESGSADSQVDLKAALVMSLTSVAFTGPGVRFAQVHTHTHTFSSFSSFSSFSHARVLSLSILISN